MTLGLRAKPRAQQEWGMTEPSINQKVLLFLSKALDAPGEGPSPSTGARGSARSLQKAKLFQFMVCFYNQPGNSLQIKLFQKKNMYLRRSKGQKDITILEVAVSLRRWWLPS